MANYSGSPSLNYYLKDIGRYPILTREEELGLFQRARQGDKEAWEKLHKSNLRFVVSIAMEYQWNNVELVDLINAGNAGMVVAAHRFDETSGFKFITYAVWWILRYILTEIATQKHIATIPVDKSQKMNRIRKALASAVANQDGRPLTSQQLSDLGITEDQMNETYAMISYQSLDAQFTDDNDGSLLNILKDENAIPPDAIADQLQYSADIDKLFSISNLNEFQEKVIRLVTGLEDRQPHSLEETANILGKKRERVRQAYELAKRKLQIAAKKLKTEEGINLPNTRT